MVESDPELPEELGSWSFARCTRHLVALMAQLKDPLGELGLLAFQPIGLFICQFTNPSVSLNPSVCELSRGCGLSWPLSMVSRSASVCGLSVLSL